MEPCCVPNSLSLRAKKKGDHSMKALQQFFILGFVAFSVLCQGQSLQEGKVNIGNQAIGYTYIEPVTAVTGVLILLPAWGEKAASVFSKTKLPQLLVEYGYITIVPQLQQSLFANEAAILGLHKILSTKMEAFGCDNPRLILGGFSAGGAIAIGYAEYLVQSNSRIKPTAVFAIDPPLDLCRLYASAENKINYQCADKLINKEGRLIKNYLLKTLKGAPKEMREAYLRYSAFASAVVDGGNAKYLKNIPIRLYSEPDLEFARNKYCQELQYDDINAVDIEKMGKFLEDIGNSNIQYIATKNRGFHSWNILQPEECVNWILKMSKDTQ